MKPKVDKDSAKVDKVRCDYYFEFKECPNKDCSVQNDVAARHCRECQTELIDPNKKLKLDTASAELSEMVVIDAKYAISDTQTGFRVNCVYRCKDGQDRVATYYENYTPSSDKDKHVFYGQFIKKHCDRPSFWYNHISDRGKMVEMLKEAKTPNKIFLKFEESTYRIKRKSFPDTQELLA